MSRRVALLLGCAFLLALAAAYFYFQANRGSGVPPDPALARNSGIHKIKHVIIILQENRSFDSYFGTYPGADGIPMKDGLPAVCSPNPQTRECIRPYLDHQNLN